jgi:hypothetical protein
VVLGIDAAWTSNEPSGVALVRGTGSAWECIALAPSYASFVSMASGTAVDWMARAVPGLPDVDGSGGPPSAWPALRSMS